MRKIEESYRTLSDRKLIGLYLLYSASKENRDGMLITNKALQNLFRVEKVYDERIRDFTRDVSNLFPYSRIAKDKLNRKILFLGFKAEVKPTKSLRITAIPSPKEIEKLLGFNTVTWTLNAPW